MPFSQFTDYINQLQNKSTVTNQSERLNDHSFMTKTVTKTDPARAPLALLIVADTYFLSSTITYPFQTNNFFKCH